MCLRDGDRRGSSGGAGCPAWRPRWGGWWRPPSGTYGTTCSAHGASGRTNGTARGAPDASETADAAAASDAGTATDASDAAAPDAGTAPDASADATSADAGPAADAAADAAAQHGWHAGAATEFSASQYGRHAQHVAAFAAERWCSAGPWYAAAARYGVTAAGLGIDGTRRNVGHRCWRHESAGRAARESRRHDPAEPAAWWWVRQWTWRSQSAWWSRRRRQPPWWRFCQSTRCRLSATGSASRRDWPASGRNRSRRCHDVARHEWRSGRPSRALHTAP